MSKDRAAPDREWTVKLLAAVERAEAKLPESPSIYLHGLREDLLKLRDQLRRDLAVHEAPDPTDA